MGAPAASDGVLTLTVWPTYVGLAAFGVAGSPVEPLDSRDYHRGQITWAVDPDGVTGPVGRGRIHAPAGVYDCLVYTQHPTSPMVSGIKPLAHPLTLSEVTPVGVDAIEGLGVGARIA